MACSPEVQAGSLSDTLWDIVLVALAATEPLPPSEGGLLQPGDPGLRIPELSSIKNYKQHKLGPLPGALGRTMHRLGCSRRVLGAQEDVLGLGW